MVRLTGWLAAVGLALGGAAGARMSRHRNPGKFVLGLGTGNADATRGAVTGQDLLCMEEKVRWKCPRRRRLKEE
jgi:hypothetical protein